MLEIGPGIGILTAALLRAGADVTAVEVDRRLAAHLRERFEGIASLRLVEGDFLDQRLRDLVDGAVGPGGEPAVPHHQPGPAPRARG